MLSRLSTAGIAVRIATKKLAAEEAPESYKDVSQVWFVWVGVGVGWGVWGARALDVPLQPARSDTQLLHPFNARSCCCAATTGHRHLSRGGHQQEVCAAAAHHCHQGLRGEIFAAEQLMEQHLAR